MSTTIHMALCVRGWLSRVSRLPKRQREREAGGFKNDDGSKPTFDQVQEFMFDHLSQGHEMIPMGPCDNFDWKTGCRGHEA